MTTDTLVYIEIRKLVSEQVKTNAKLDELIQEIKNTHELLAVIANRMKENKTNG